jgi:Ion channel
MSEVRAATTPSEVLKRENADHRNWMVPRRENGVIIFVSKVLLHTLIWNWIYRFAVWTILKVVGRLDKTTDKPELWVRHAADAYMVLAGMIEVVCYCLLLNLARTANNADFRPCFPILALCVFPVFRLVEAFSVVVKLHANGRYHPPYPMRAVSRILWTYLECVAIFGSLYLAVVALTGDKFGTVDDPGFLKCWVNPLYFSMITISTVGYGDFAPQSGWGRSIVVLEVFCGLLLLVVVLQRVLAASLPRQPEQQYAEPAAARDRSENG